MLVSNQTNNYQVTLPVVPQEPTYSNKEIYEASEGNLVRSNNGDIALTPQGETNIANAKDTKNSEIDAQTQATKDAQRGVAVDYIDAQSKKSQVEIYLSVATDDKVSLDNDTASVIESLRDVQKQNNAVEAYATYQNSTKAVLY